MSLDELRRNIEARQRRRVRVRRLLTAVGGVLLLGCYVTASLMLKAHVLRVEVAPKDVAARRRQALPGFHVADIHRSVAAALKAAASLEPKTGELPPHQTRQSSEEAEEFGGPIEEEEGESEKGLPAQLPDVTADAEAQDEREEAAVAGKAAAAEEREEREEQEEQEGREGREEQEEQEGREDRHDDDDSKHPHALAHMLHHVRRSRTQRQSPPSLPQPSQPAAGQESNGTAATNDGGAGSSTPALPEEVKSLRRRAHSFEKLIDLLLTKYAKETLTRQQSSATADDTSASPAEEGIENMLGKLRELNAKLEEVHAIYVREELGGDAAAGDGAVDGSTAAGAAAASANAPGAAMIERHRAVLAELSTDFLIARARRHRNASALVALNATMEAPSSLLSSSSSLSSPLSSSELDEMAMTRPVRRDDATARRPTMDDPPGGVPDHGEGNGGSKELDMSSWRHVHVESPQGARVKLDSDGVALPVGERARQLAEQSRGWSEGKDAIPAVASVSQLIAPFSSVDEIKLPPLLRPDGKPLSTKRRARADQEVAEEAAKALKARGGSELAVEAAQSDGLDDLSVAELKARLKEVDKSTEGGKAALVHRLRVAAADEPPTYASMLRKFQEDQKKLDEEDMEAEAGGAPDDAFNVSAKERMTQHLLGSKLPPPSPPELRPVLPGPACRRWFKIGARADFVNSIKPAAQALGMCEAKSLGEHAHAWHLWWSLPKFWVPERFLKEYVPDGGIINVIPGLYHALGDKPSLARLQVQCFEDHGFSPLAPLPVGSPDCRFTGRGWPVHRDNETHRIRGFAHPKFRAYNLATTPEQRNGESHNIWILKPVGGFNQVGIHMFNYDNTKDGASEEATGRWLEKHVPDGEWVLQEYVMNPLTFRGHKFDVRLWAAVTSLDPLRVYVLRAGIPKISQWPYSSAADQTKEQCMHVLLPGTDECFASKRAVRISPYPSKTDRAEFLSRLGRVDGRACDAACWWGKVWPSAEWRIVEVLLLARRRILEQERPLKEAGRRFKRVALLQPDLVFDTTGNAVLVECNMNGYMVGDAHKDYFSLQYETEALLELIGASGYPRQLGYARALNRHIDEFCAKEPNGCSATARLELAELAHETHHANSGWAKAFPAGEDKPHVKHFRRSPVWGAMLSQYDRMYMRWLRFKRRHLAAVDEEQIAEANARGDVYAGGADSAAERGGGANVSRPGATLQGKLQEILWKHREHAAKATEAFVQRRAQQQQTTAPSVDHGDGQAEPEGATDGPTASSSSSEKLSHSHYSRYVSPSPSNTSKVP